jgi:transposase
LPPATRWKIERIAIAFEAGGDGFWLARWLTARGIEAHVIHASSVAVSREHRRAKTDRLDTELLNGCAVNVITARSQSRQWRTKMPSDPTASARVSLSNKLGSSTAESSA